MTTTCCAPLKALALLTILLTSCAVVDSPRVTPWIFDVQHHPGSARLFVTVKHRGPDKEAPISLRVIEADATGRTSRRVLTVADDIKEMTTTSVSPDGLRIAVVSPGVRVFTAAGDLIDEFSDGHTYPVVKWSPDSSQLAMVVSSPPEYRKFLVLWSPGEGVRRTLAGDLRASGVIEWSPDGQHIIFLAQTPSKPQQYAGNLVIQDISSGERREVASGARMMFGAAWRPKSETIVWAPEWPEEVETQLWVRDLSAVQERLAARLPGHMSGLRWSPDGDWLAFLWTSLESGPTGKRRWSPSVLPAEAVLDTKPAADVQRSMSCVWEPTEKGSVLQEWNASGELLFSEDHRVLKAFDPRTKKSRFVLALRDGEITFTPPEPLD